MPLIILILAVVGAVADWRYLQKGGREPSRKDWIYFLVSIALVAVLLVVLKSLGGGNFIEGTAPIIIHAVRPLGIGPLEGPTQLPVAEKALAKLGFLPSPPAACRKAARGRSPLQGGPCPAAHARRNAPLRPIQAVPFGLTSRLRVAR
jgi:hypothetical protein